MGMDGSESVLLWQLVGLFAGAGRGAYTDDNAHIFMLLRSLFMDRGGEGGGI